MIPMVFSILWETRAPPVLKIIFQCTVARLNSDTLLHACKSTGPLTPPNLNRSKYVLAVSREMLNKSYR